MKNLSACSLLFWLYLPAILGQFSDPDLVVAAMPSTGNFYIDQIDGTGSADFVFSDASSFRWFSYDYAQQTLLPRTFTIDKEVQFLRHLYMEDLDNDGDQDYVGVHLRSLEVIWLEKLDEVGNLKYHSLDTLAFSPSVSDWRFRSGDLDRNGLPDLVSANHTGGMRELALYLQTAPGVFEKMVISDDGPGFENLHVLDMDQDADLDIFVQTGFSNNQQWTVYENISGQGNIWEPVIIATQDKTRDLQIIDFDQDGLPDIFQLHVEGLYWFRATGKYEFERIKIHDGNVPFAIADLDVDGQLDVLLHNRITGSPPAVLWYDGEKFTKQRLTDEKVECFSVHFHDFDLDDRPELLFGGSRSWRMLQFDPDVSKYEVSSPLAPAGLNQYFFHDLDADGDLDAIIRDTEGVSCLENIGLATQVFNHIPKYYLRLDQVDPEVYRSDKFAVHFFADEALDKDERLEILFTVEYALQLTGAQTTYHVLHHDEDFQFSLHPHVADLTPSSTSTHLTDLNNDGLRDIVYRQQVYDSIFAMTGREDGNFDPPRKLTDTAVPASIISSADMDLDGDLDIILDKDRQMYWISNDSAGAGPVNSPRLYSTFFYDNTAQQISAVDINNDQQVDLIKSFKQFPREAHILFNQGNGIFALQKRFSNSPAFLPTDLDRDGWIDLIAGNHFYHNNQGFFGLDSVVLLPTPVDGVQLVEFGNGYSSPDIVLRQWNRIYLIQNYLQAPKIRGRVFRDNNQNGLLDPGEHGLGRFKITLDNGTRQWQTFTDPNGIFSHYTGWEGPYTISAEELDLWALTSPAVITLEDAPAIDTFLTFGYYPTEMFTQGAVYLSGQTFRCNQTIQLGVSLHNTGTTHGQMSASITYDSLLTFDQASPDPTALDTVNHRLIWRFDDLYPLQQQQIQLQFLPVGAEHFGKEIAFKAALFLPDGGIDSLLSEDEYAEIIRCAYDPNDKLVYPSRPDKTIQPEEGLIYTIRFQNTGNDTAIQVSIRDTLDQMLDAKTIRPISASHLYSMSVQNELIEFLFPNIYLPDSTTNYEKSMGYVQFAVDPVETFASGDTILNRAAIYFDQNAPIITNTTINTLATPNFSVSPAVQETSLLIYPNPGSRQIQAILKGSPPSGPVNFLLMDSSGRILLQQTSDRGRTQFDIRDLSSGFYLITAKDQYGNSLGSTKLIK